MKLKPIGHGGEPIEFDWDPKTGDLRGPDAEVVARMADEALSRGTLVGHPHPTVFDITDPLRKPPEMAVLLGQFWLLPDDLARAYPEAEQEVVEPGTIY